MVEKNSYKATELTTQDIIKLLPAHLQALDPQDPQRQKAVKVMYKYTKFMEGKPSFSFPMNTKEGRANGINQDHILHVLDFLGYRIRVNENNEAGDSTVLYKNKRHQISTKSPVLNTIIGDVQYTISILTHGLKTSDTAIKQAVLSLDNFYYYNPLKDIFENLPEWDGVDRLTPLTDGTYIKVAEEEKDLYPHYFKRWIYGAVHKVYSDTNFQNDVLVLASPQNSDGSGQGQGKSSFVEWLALPFSKHNFYYEGGLVAKTKDDLFKLADFFIAEWTEMRGFSSSNDDSIKASLTANYISERRAWGITTTPAKNICNIIATRNPQGDRGFLRDLSGNRRFMVVTVLDFDFAYSGGKKGYKEQDYVAPEHVQLELAQQLWAQVLYDYKINYLNKPSHERKQFWQLSRLLKQEQNKTNDTYHESTPLEAMLEQLIDTGYPDDCIDTLEILTYVCNATIPYRPTNTSNAQIGRFMTRKGIKSQRTSKWNSESGKRDSVTKYYGVTINKDHPLIKSFVEKQDLNTQSPF